MSGKMFSKSITNKIILVLLVLLAISCSQQTRTLKDDIKRYEKFKTKVKKHSPRPLKTKRKKEKLPGENITITMDFQDAKLSDVLRVIAKEFKVNLVVPNDDKSRVTVYLYNATLHEALDMILSSLDYSYFKKGQTYLILKNTEIISRVYRLKYSKAVEVQQVLEGMSETAHIKADELTNSVVITDELGNMKAYNDIIQTLDSFQPSVMIEAEIFEVSLDHARNIGVEWGIDYNESPHQLKLTSPFSVSATGLVLDYTSLKSTEIKLMLY